MFSSTARTVLHVTLILFASVLLQCKSQQQASPLSDKRYIAHAMGAVAGVVLTNSHEAFFENYKKGRRVFEADFAMTADGHVVLFHEKPAFGMEIPVYLQSHSQFMNFRYMGKYTPMDLRGLVSLLEKNPEMILVTDTKESFDLIMYILEEISRQRPGLMGRIIPQVYSPGDYDRLISRFPAQEAIYSLYKNEDISDDLVLAHVSTRPRITAVTVSPRRFNPSLARRLSDIDTYVYVHTLNEEATINKFIGQGAHGVYTDYYFR
jgi:glycerophosphoryl diester phosphodiesterase